MALQFIGPMTQGELKATLWGDYGTTNNTIVSRGLRTLTMYGYVEERKREKESRTRPPKEYSTNIDKFSEYMATLLEPEGRYGKHKEKT